MKRFGKETPSSPGRWRALKIAIFSLTPAVILVVVAEATASMVIARRAAVTSHAKGGSVYSLQVGRGPWSRLSVTPLNSLGFPDEEFPPAGERDACARVIFAGDSFILGDGVHRDSNFVEIVRRRVSGTRGGGLWQRPVRSGRTERNDSGLDQWNELDQPPKTNNPGLERSSFGGRALCSHGRTGNSGKF